MRNLKKVLSGMLVLMMSFIMVLAVSVGAEEYYADSASGDNSLYSLGLENASEISPEFYYSTTEYNVTVPAGTSELLLDPVKSDSNAEILDISGTTLENGSGTVSITVQAENGARVTYTLHVTSEAAAETEEETEEETEKQTEDAETLARLTALESEKAELENQKAQWEQKEGQITLLQTENDDLAYRLDLLMKALYGLVAFAVILLFFIINQSFRNKDMKDDIKKMKKDMQMGSGNAGTSDYYYAPVQQTSQPIYVAPQEAEPVLSKKEMKQLEKEAKRAAKLEAKQNKKKNEEAPAAPITPVVPVTPVTPVTPVVPVEPAAPVQPSAPVQPAAPVQPSALSAEEAAKLDAPTFVQSSVEEPDIQVDMIDL